jgi:hypothetical protein
MKGELKDKIMGRENRVDNKYKDKIDLMLANREPITEECTGCKRIEGNVCNAAISPKAKWRLGFCTLATHKILVEDSPEEKKRAGQQKSKKKSKR